MITLECMSCENAGFESLQEIEYDIEPYSPGRTSGPPEKCYPPEGGYAIPTNADELPYAAMCSCGHSIYDHEILGAGQHHDWRGRCGAPRGEACECEGYFPAAVATDDCGRVRVAGPAADYWPVVEVCPQCHGPLPDPCDAYREWEDQQHSRWVDAEEARADSLQDR